MKLKYGLKLNRDYLAGLVFVLITITLFLILFVNKSIVLQEGWYTYHAKQIADGLIPYKDFPVVVTPFSLFLYSLFYKFFGDAFIVMHYAGMVARLVLFWSVYHVFAKFFPYKVAAFATIAGAVIYISKFFDNGVLTYNDITFILAFLSLNFVFNYLKKLDETSKISYSNLVIVSLISAVSLVNKQTFGIIVPFFTLLVILLFTFKKSGLKDAMKSCLTFFVAYIPVCGLVGLYFYTNGAFPAFVDNAFLSGVQAKGNLFSVLTQYFSFLGEYAYFPYIFIGSFLLIFLYVYCKNKKVNFSIGNKDLIRFFFYSIFASCVTIVLAHLFFDFVASVGFVYTHFTIMNNIMAFMVFITTIYIFYLFCKIVVENKYDFETIKTFLLFGSVVAMDYAMILSMPAPYTCFAAFSLCFAFALDNKTFFPKYKNSLLYLVVYVMLFYSVIAKMYSPVNWNVWLSGAVNKDLQYSKSIPVLKGMFLPTAEIETLEEIKKQVDVYTTKEDVIFAYNSIPAFYEILERKPSTLILSHYWDVCPDKYAQQDAETLLAKPPKVIVYMQISKQHILDNERQFRAGALSGQRDIDVAILNMVKDKKFIPVLVYENQQNPSKYIQNPELLEQYQGVKKELMDVSINIQKKQYADMDDTLEFYKRSKLQSLSREIELYANKSQMKYPFLDRGYKLMLLVRSDVYKEKQK